MSYSAGNELTKSSVIGTRAQCFPMIAMLIDRGMSVPFCKRKLSIYYGLYVRLLRSVTPFQHDPCCMRVRDGRDDLPIIVLYPQCYLSVRPGSSKLPRIKLASFVGSWLIAAG